MTIRGEGSNNAETETCTTAATHLRGQIFHAGGQLNKKNEKKGERGERLGIAIDRRNLLPYNYQV
jgi:hypothetical protein